MNKNGRWFVVIVLIGLLVAWLTACGGGGDDDSSPNDTPQTPTNTVDADTVDQIMDDVSAMGIGCTAGDGAAASSKIVSAVRALGKKTTEKVRTAFEESKIQDQMRAPVAQDPIIFNSDCPPPNDTGEMRIEMTIDDETGEYEGTLTFTNFCLETDVPEQFTVVGGVQFDGVIVQDDEGVPTSITLNANTTDPVEITLGCDRATVVLTGFSLFHSGAEGENTTLRVSWTALNIDILDCDGESEFIHTSNVAINVTITPEGAITTTVEGVLSSSEGTLVVSTTSPITIDADGNITGGVIQIDGADNTGVQITYAGSGYVFDVTADTNGDGVYDDYDNEMDCSQLDGDVDITWHTRD